METPPTVLLISASPPSITLMHMNLQRRGYEVMVATDGEEGFALLATREADLVLLDLQTPGLGGLAALHRVRARSAARAIICTTQRRDGETAMAADLGVVAYLVKPFGVPALLDGVRLAMAAA